MVMPRVGDARSVPPLAEQVAQRAAQTLHDRAVRRALETVDLVSTNLVHFHQSTFSNGYAEDPILDQAAATCRSLKDSGWYEPTA
jgi:hypothetical protein